MKNWLLSIALLLPAFALVGCGGSSDTAVIEGVPEEPAMTNDQQAEYEAMMNSGGGGSSPTSSGPGQ